MASLSIVPDIDVKVVLLGESAGENNRGALLAVCSSGCQQHWEPVTFLVSLLCRPSRPPSPLFPLADFLFPPSSAVGKTTLAEAFALGYATQDSYKVS